MYQTLISLMVTILFWATLAAASCVDEMLTNTLQSLLPPLKITGLQELDPRLETLLKQQWQLLIPSHQKRYLSTLAKIKFSSRYLGSGCKISGEVCTFPIPWLPLRIELPMLLQHHPLLRIALVHEMAHIYRFTLDEPWQFTNLLRIFVSRRAERNEEEFAIAKEYELITSAIHPNSLKELRILLPVQSEKDKEDHLRVLRRLEINSEFITTLTKRANETDAYHQFWNSRFNAMFFSMVESALNNSREGYINERMQRAYPHLLEPSIAF